MKTAKQILSDITGYSVDELTERNTEPLLQAEDCLTAMYCFLAQQQANGVEQSDSNCNIPVRCFTKKPTNEDELSINNKTSIE